MEVSKIQYGTPLSYPEIKRVEKKNINSNYNERNPQLAYPKTYYVSNPILDKRANDKYFEEIYNKYCTLDKVMNHIPKFAPMNIDFDKEKNHFKGTYQNAIKLGAELKLNDYQMEILKLGAIIHDIGKSSIPTEILNKNGKLTDEERKIVDKHSMYGYEIAKNMGFQNEILEIIKNHHNNNDTSNLLVEIIKLSDRYDALTSKRAYKEPFPKEMALQILRNEVNENKINKDVFRAFLNCV